MRDFKIKYKRSVLGVLWSLLNPLLTMVVLTLVFSKIFRWGEQDLNYPVYLLSGLVIFNYFNEASTLGMGSVVNNFSLITKVYIPKYIFPLSKCLFIGINFLLTLIPLYAIIIQQGVGITWHHILLPYDFVCLFFFTLGIALFMSSIAVFLRDMFYIYGIITMIWMYLTPIMYPMVALPDLLVNLMKFNPLFQYINFARDIILLHQIPTMGSFLACAGAAIVSVIFGTVVFKMTQDKFIYYI